MPRLVPGILALSRRARYFSFYPFLIREFQERRIQPTIQRLSEFIKRRELHLAIAVMLCERDCRNNRASAVGTQRATAIVNSGQDPVASSESVESNLGGYGLYYRTPLSDLGVTARAGTLHGETPLPVDVIAGDSGDTLAKSFKAAIVDTEYYRRYFYSTDPVPIRVLEAYAQRACLCRLSDYPDETRAIREVVLGDQGSLLSTQRRQSFAMFLQLVSRDTAAATDLAVFRDAVWASFADSSLQTASMKTTLTRAGRH
jgi:hypothetical protein